MGGNMEKLAESAALTRTYAGVLDDVMIRFGRGQEFLSPDFFNKMILKNVLFGSGIYLNDGYLVNHPMARKYLANPESLLRMMISTGFIRILSRESDADKLASMPEKMAESGNIEFARLVASDEWQTHLKGTFRTTVTAAYHNGTVRAWPRYDMSDGFCKLIDRIFDRQPHNLGLRHTTQSDLMRIRDAFYERAPRKGNSRHQFEMAAKQINENYPKDQFEDRMEEIMNIANQAYHYNFGMTLNAEESFDVAADTTIGMAFDELLNVRTIERAQLDSIPLISFPKEIPYDDGNLFLPFIRADHPISKVKIEFMESLDRLISDNSHNLFNLSQEAREAADAYRKQMKEYFETKVGATNIDRVFDENATFGINAGSDSASVTAAPSAHLAVAMQRASSNQKRAFLLERFKLQDVTDEFNSAPDATIFIGDLSPQLASLAFDKAEANKFVSDLRRFD